MSRRNSIYNPNLPSPYQKKFSDIYNPESTSPYKRVYADIYNPRSSSPYLRESNPRNNRIGSGVELSLKREVNYYIKDFLALADDYANLVETIISDTGLDSNVRTQYSIPTVVSDRFYTLLDSLDALEEAKREDMDTDDSLPALSTALSSLKGLHMALMSRVDHPKLGEAIRANAGAVIEQARSDYNSIRKMTVAFGGVRGGEY
jgi:hypothetical protein